MENSSDLDTSSESEYESSRGSEAGSDYDEDEPGQDFELERSEFHDKYENAPWNQEAQLQAQLHAEIKA
jgi:hypothetical protein